MVVQKLMKIKIYTWKEYLQRENRGSWFPLLFELYHLKNERLLKKYDFVNDLDEANFFILPLDVGWFSKNRKEHLFLEILQIVKSKGKIMWIYSAGDYGKSIYDECLFTFRLGGFDSKLNDNTFILPSFINDPLELYKIKPTTLEKASKPSIGFIGRANDSVYSYLYDIGIFIMLYFRRILGNNYVDHQAFFSSSRRRFYILEKLRQHPDLKTDFVYRRKYKAGAKKEEDRLKTKKEFLSNIERNALTLCYRGQGNYSVRLYEVLAMGRIPILVESDFRLPLPWKNWQNHIIRCGECDVDDKIIEFYKGVSEEILKEKQIENRIFWKKNLTRTGFFQEIHSYFIECGLV